MRKGKLSRKWLFRYGKATKKKSVNCHVCLRGGERRGRWWRNGRAIVESGRKNWISFHPGYPFIVEHRRRTECRIRRCSSGEEDEERRRWTKKKSISISKNMRRWTRTISSKKKFISLPNNLRSEKNHTTEDKNFYRNIRIRIKQGKTFFEIKLGKGLRRIWPKHTQSWNFAGRVNDTRSIVSVEFVACSRVTRPPRIIWNIKHTHTILDIILGPFSGPAIASPLRITLHANVKKNLSFSGQLRRKTKAFFSERSQNGR